MVRSNLEEIVREAAISVLPKNIKDAIDALLAKGGSKRLVMKAVRRASGPSGSLLIPAAAYYMGCDVYGGDVDTLPPGVRKVGEP